MIVPKVHNNTDGVEMALQKIQNHVRIVGIGYFNPAVGRKFHISNPIIEHTGFWSKFFKCCGIGNRSQQRGMFASGKCQCAIHYPVSIIEIVYTLCLFEV